MRLTGGRMGWIGVGVAALCAAFATPRAVAHDRDEPVRCASHDGHLARCAIPGRDARLIKRESRAACIRGQSWGVDRGVLWVDRGCRGVFAVDWRYRDDRPGRYERGERYDHRHGDDRWRPAPGWDRDVRLQCDSNKRRYQLCRVDLGRHGHARMVRQLSDARCTQGYSWGWNRAGVWVDHGCRAQFLVDRRW